MCDFRLPQPKYTPDSLEHASLRSRPWQTWTTTTPKASSPKLQTGAVWRVCLKRGSRTGLARRQNLKMHKRTSTPGYQPMSSRHCSQASKWSAYARRSSRASSSLTTLAGATHRVDARGGEAVEDGLQAAWPLRVRRLEERRLRSRARDRMRVRRAGRGVARSWILGTPQGLQGGGRRHAVARMEAGARCHGS